MSRFPSRRNAVILIALGLVVLVFAPVGADVRAAGAASDVANSPVGRWKTFDDATGKLKSIVDISQQNGEFDGTIETLFDPPVPHPTCYLCSGAKKDVPLVGLQVLWGFRPDGDAWSGGQVLDPETGKIYRASMALEDDGKTLRLHGYIVIPLLGRTEHWVRAE